VETNDDLDKAVTTVVQTAELNVDSAISALAQAHNSLSSAYLGVQNAFEALSIAKAASEGADAADQKVKIEREKAVVMGGIQAGIGILKGAEKYMNLRTPNAKGEVKSPAEAAGGAGAVDAIGGVVTYLVGQSYDNDIYQVQLKLDSITQFIAAHQQVIAENNVAAARNTFNSALEAVKQAQNNLRKAETDRQAALKDLAAKAKAQAAKGGASEADQDRLQAAILARPAVELVIARVKEILGKFQVPGYTKESGRGAALALNADEFMAHLGTMMNGGPSLQGEAVIWQARLDEINNLIKSLHS
jgi:hypothetical protein